MALDKQSYNAECLYAKCHKQAVNAECLYAKCRYAECCGAMHHWGTSNKCHEFKVIVEKN